VLLFEVFDAHAEDVDTGLGQLPAGLALLGLVAVVVLVVVGRDVVEGAFSPPFRQVGGALRRLRRPPAGVQGARGRLAGRLAEEERAPLRQLHLRTVSCSQLVTAGHKVTFFGRYLTAEKDQIDWLTASNGEEGEAVQADHVHPRQLNHYLGDLFKVELSNQHLIT